MMQVMKRMELESLVSIKCCALNYKLTGNIFVEIFQMSGVRVVGKLLGAEEFH